MSRHDLLVQPPPWAPSWVPSMQRSRSVRALRWAIGVVLVAGVVACVSEGANSPPDPVLAPPSEVVDVTDADRASLCAEPDGDFGSETAALLSTFASAPATVTTGDDSVDLCVLVAPDAERRARGLMTVTDFEGFDGMVFTYDEDSSGAYYMFNTPTPLSISWWDSTGALVSTAEMEPCLDLPAAECPRYAPDGPYRYVLEVPEGALAGTIDDTSVLSLGEISG